jgi:rapamycin-insensitive companion of mTOR
MELIQGPLLNPKRLDEAIRATKFIRRLFSFFHPYNNWFSAIKRTRVNLYRNLVLQLMLT